MGYTLITGCNGFIGRKIVQKLIEMGQQIIALSMETDCFFKNRDVVYRCIDITDNESLSALFDKYQIDTVIHLAAIAHVGRKDNNKWEDYKSVNYLASANLFNLAAAARAKIFFASTVDVYGQTCGGVVGEDYACNPLSDYGKSKNLAEKALIDLAQKQNLLYVIARLAPVYDKNCLTDVYKRIYIKAPWVAFLIGRGNQAFHFCSVYNVVDFIASWMSQKKAFIGILNICDKQPVSAKSLIGMEKKAGRAIFVVRIPTVLVKLVFAFLGFIWGRRYGVKIIQNQHKILNPTKWSNQRLISEFGTPKWTIQNTVFENIV